jgi:flagellar biosynthesis GTPase FlhF
MPNPWVNIARGFTKGTQAYLEKTVGERKRREEEERQRSQRWADVRESRQYQREQTEESRRYQEGKEAKADIERKEEKEWAEIQRDLAEGMQQFAKIHEDDQNERKNRRDTAHKSLADFGTDKTILDLVNRIETDPSTENLDALYKRIAQLKAKKIADNDIINDWYDVNGVNVGKKYRKEVEGVVEAVNYNWERLISYLPTSEPGSDTYQRELDAILSPPPNGANYANIYEFEIALEKAERIKNRLNRQFYAKPTETAESIQKQVEIINKNVDYILNAAGGHGDPIKKEDFIHKVKIKDQIAIEWAMLVVDPIKSKMALQELRNLGIDLNEKDVKNLSKWIK